MSLTVQLVKRFIPTFQYDISLTVQLLKRFIPAFQYDSSSGWPSSMEMPAVSMYGDPRGGLDQVIFLCKFIINQIES